MKKSVLHEIKVLDHLIIRNLFSRQEDAFQEGLTLSQIQILGYLVKNKDKEVYQNDLESVFHLRRATVSGVLKTMEKKDFIKRETSLKDARTKKIILQPETLQKCQRAKKHIIDFEALLEKNLSKEELDLFFKVILKMQENLQRKEDITYVGPLNKEKERKEIC